MGQSLKRIIKIFSVILHIYLSRFKPKDLCWQTAHIYNSSIFTMKKNWDTLLGFLFY